MKFSIWPHLSGKFSDLIDICSKAETSGWDGIWVADHFMPNTGDQSTTSGPTSEAWTTLAAVSALVPRVRIGTLVTGNTYRNPAVLAKMAAEVDVISNGRLVLGLGAGWQQNEHLSYGIEFSTVGGRLARLRESIQIIRSLLDQEFTSFSGKYYEITNAPLSPKPVQSRLPILVGGGGEKVTLKITAMFADEWNVWGSPEVLKQKGRILDQHCDAIDRDPLEIRRSAQALFFLSKDSVAVERAKESATDRLIAGSPDEIVEVIAQYAEAGVSELIVPNFNMGNTDKVNETYDFWMHDVIRQLS